MKRILVINPGSTSTKIAVFDDANQILSNTIDHSYSEIEKYNQVTDQFEFRKEAVLSTLKEANISLESLDAVVGRGGMITPIKPGGYLVTENMKERILTGNIRQHASNLGALIADAIAKQIGIPAYIYDAVASDEMDDIARITGVPEIKRQPYAHVLNSKAMVRKYAEMQGKKYEDVNVLVCHIGGGVSVSVHKKGRIIDSIEDDGGPFSIERAGVIPTSYIVNMAFSGQYTKSELSRKLSGMGGVKAHLGTTDLREVERRINEGDEYAKQIFEALAYQISKGIGELSPVLEGDCDAIILTGGAANSKKLTELITRKVSFIAPVIVLPGENEMESLALGALRLLNGEESAQLYGE